MKGFALGVIDDLRARQLWPVALLLAVALVAVPLFMLKPAEELPPPAAAAAPTASPVPGGLPGPEEALEQGSQPLVSLAVLNSPSDLENFSSKNPFKPLEEVATLDAGDALVNGDPTATAAVGDDSTGGGGGGDVTGGGDGGGGGVVPDLPAPLPQPQSPVAPTIPERQYTYAVDLTFDGPGPLRRYRNLPRLSMLPSEENPLLVFLGVSASGNSAVFLVDSTLHAQGGEGNCNPSPSECATLTIEPGEEQVFIDDQDRRYVIQIDQIRRRPLSGRAAAASEVQARTADEDDEEGSLLSRFVPLLPDVVVTGGQE